MSNHLAVIAGPGTGKTYTAAGITRYIRATNKKIFLSENKHTEEQLAIWNWVDTHIVPNIVDRTGQPRMPKILVAAYNNEIVDDIKPYVSKTADCLTIHGAGYKYLTAQYGWFTVNKSRGIMIVEKLKGMTLNEMPSKFFWIGLLKFIEKAKDELVDLTLPNLEMLKNKYEDLASYKPSEDMIEEGKKVLLEMKRMDRSLGLEFVDQVWLALFAVKEPVYDIGIVDEGQDLSPARWLLVQKLCKHLIVVGDNNQAINAWAGADPYSFDKIMAFCGNTLPLKTSFRCPPNIIKKANALAPSAQLKGLDKPEGLEDRIMLSALPKYITSPSDTLIICRYNAPLINCALKLLKAGISCAIKGNSLVDMLTSIVNGFNATSLDHLRQKIDNREGFLTQGAPPHIIEQIHDKMDCLRMVVDQVDDIIDVVPMIKKLFAPDKKDHVQLSSIHRAKGRERKNVFIMNPPVESDKAKTPEQKQQERNLHFVAITRTSQNLYWILDDAK